MYFQTTLFEMSVKESLFYPPSMYFDYLFRPFMDQSGHYYGVGLILGGQQIQIIIPLCSSKYQ